MTNKDLIEIGFEKMPHFTVANSVIYPLGRNRQLSAGSVGTPNEMLWICEIDTQNETKISDLICLHNYDYDGVLTMEKVKSIINVITGRAFDDDCTISKVCTKCEHPINQ